MSLPLVTQCLACPACSSTNVEMSATPLAVKATCRGCRRSWPHPDQSFARDVLRGRERIEVRG